MNHLVIYNKNLFGYDYIAAMLNGTKTMGAKFRANRTAPYQKLHDGDYLYLKESSGPIRGRLRVQNVVNQELAGPEDVMEFLVSNADEFGISSESRLMEIWQQNATKRYLCTWRMERAETAHYPVFIAKRDRRAWVPEFEPGEEVLVAFL